MKKCNVYCNEIVIISKNRNLQSDKDSCCKLRRNEAYKAVSSRFQGWILYNGMKFLLKVHFGIILFTISNANVRCFRQMAFAPNLGSKCPTFDHSRFRMSYIVHLINAYELLSWNKSWIISNWREHTQSKHWDGTCGKSHIHNINPYMFQFVGVMGCFIYVLYLII